MHYTLHSVRNESLRHRYRIQLNSSPSARCELSRWARRLQTTNPLSLRAWLRGQRAAVTTTYTPEQVKQHLPVHHHQQQ